MPFPIAAVAVAPVVVAAPVTVVTPMAVPPAMVDDYIYYPEYEIYYSPTRQVYIYLNGRVWVASPVPGRIPQVELRSAPSVRMSFHDAPSNHHAATVQMYPRNWNPNQPQPVQPRK